MSITEYESVQKVVPPAADAASSKAPREGINDQVWRYVRQLPGYAPTMMTSSCCVDSPMYLTKLAELSCPPPSECVSKDLASSYCSQPSVKGCERQPVVIASLMTYKGEVFTPKHEDRQASAGIVVDELAVAPHSEVVARAKPSCFHSDLG